jgi:hypothetical protein
MDDAEENLQILIFHFLNIGDKLQESIDLQKNKDLEW